MGRRNSLTEKQMGIILECAEKFSKEGSKYNSLEEYLKDKIDEILDKEENIEMQIPLLMQMDLEKEVDEAMRWLKKMEKNQEWKDRMKKKKEDEEKDSDESD